MWVERLNSNQASIETNPYDSRSYGNRMIETQIGSLFEFLFVSLSLHLFSILVAFGNESLRVRRVLFSYGNSGHGKGVLNVRSGESHFENADS